MLPDSPGQSGKCLRLVDYAVGIDFKDWSNYPFVGPFDDGVEEKLAMLVGCKVRLDVQMYRPPVPPLRHDPGPVKSCAGAANTRQ